MKLLKKIKDHIVYNFKILTLWDVRDNFSLNHYFRIFITLLLNILASIAKILAPASLAKAVEMVALSEEEYSVGSLSLSPTHLLYLSVGLTTWIKSEVYLKKFILREFEKLQINANAMKMIRTAHQLPFEKHTENKPVIPKTILEIINYQSKLVTEVLTNISQSLLDIIMGTILIWRRYGKLLGSEFLIYCALDMFFLSFFVDFITNQTQVFAKLDKSLHGFINHEYEILNYEETVRLFHHEALETRFSKKLLDKYLERNSRFQLTEDIAASLKIIPIIIANIIPVSYMLKETISLHDLDDFIFLLSYINIFGGSITSLNQSMKICMRAVQSIARQNLFHEQNNVVAPIKRSLPSLHQPIVENTSPLIEFKDVVFSYPHQSTPTLKNMTFSIPPGKMVGIIGRSNAGKSTIIKLLFGLYKQQSGSIKLNGHSIEDIPQKVLAKIFCCVPQNAELFRDRSLKYNVLYGMDNDEVIYNYANKKTQKQKQVTNYHTLDLELNEVGAQNEQEVDNTTNEFTQTMIKVNLAALVNSKADDKKSAVTLSGGQRQRVGIARALVRHSSVFIFDESSSALDSFTESEVLRNVKKITRDKTTLMITHRLATVKDVEEIMVIENGCVVEQGAPNQLLEKQGVYYQYWQSQMCH